MLLLPTSSLSGEDGALDFLSPESARSVTLLMVLSLQSFVHCHAHCALLEQAAAVQF